jgi:hypothetical protein
MDEPVWYEYDERMRRPDPLPVFPHTHSCLNNVAHDGGIRVWLCDTPGCIMAPLMASCPVCDPPAPHEPRCRCGHCPSGLPPAA